jgi:hypothetical protein
MRPTNSSLNICSVAGLSVDFIYKQFISLGIKCGVCYVETSVVRYYLKRVVATEHLFKNRLSKRICVLSFGSACIFWWRCLWQTIPQLPVGSGCVCCECDKVQQASRCLRCLSTRRLSSCDASSFNCATQFISMTGMSCTKPRSMQHNLTKRPRKDLHRRIWHHVLYYCQINSDVV